MRRQETLCIILLQPKAYNYIPQVNTLYILRIFMYPPPSPPPWNTFNSQQIRKDTHTAQ